MRRAATLGLLLAACAGEPAAAPPSDDAFLAARAATAATLQSLFTATDWYAPDPEGSGAPTLALWAASAPDPHPLATAGAVDLPAATPRLAPCRDATLAALAAFREGDGPFLGEGSMAGAGVQRISEVSRQRDAAVHGFCLWRDATRLCRDQATAAALAAIPAAFEPRFLDCP
jgi:hypothetical protein